MPLRRLESGEIQPGIPLPGDLFDRGGRLMIRTGQVIATESQVERLLDAGVQGDVGWSPEPPSAATTRPDRTSVFDRMAALREAVAADFDAAGADGSPSADAFTGHAAALQALCRVDPNAALGTILLQRGGDYGTRHCVNTAILSALLVRHHGDADADATVAAALSMNVAMRALQNALYAQQAPLDDAQKQQIREHPRAGVARLQGAGVRSRAWLEVVACHHELTDGSGYPRGLAGDSIPLAAAIVGLADRYTAMVSERAYRPGAAPNAALRHLLVTQGKTIDPRLAALLIREMGTHPPGTPVRLASGEAAIVVKPSLNAAQPIVRAVLNGAGLRLAGLPKRRTSVASHAITEVLPWNRVPADLDGAKLWPPAAAEDAAEDATDEET